MSIPNPIIPTNPMANAVQPDAVSDEELARFIRRAKLKRFSFAALALRIAEDLQRTRKASEPEPMRPDMLAALKTAYTAISRPEIYTVHPVAAARITILDAIEKAEGRG